MPKAHVNESNFEYEGFSSPNGTIVPDDVFDKLMPHLSDIELRVLLYIIRRTFGFKKNSDDISLSQIVSGITTHDGRMLDQGAGVSKPSAIKAVRLLEAKRIIVKQSNESAERGFEPTTYTLRFRGDPLSTGFTRGSKRDLQGLVNGVDIQQTELQKTVKQQTEDSNSFELIANLQQNSNSKFSKNRDKIEKSGAQRGAEPAEPSRQASSFKPVGQLLSGRGVGRAAKTASVVPKNGSESAYYPSAGTESRPALETASQARRGRPRKYPVPPGLELFTSDITAEFHDSSKLPSNLSFIGRVLHETGLHPDMLYQLMQEARQLTKSRGNIEKASADDPGFRNRWPYFRSTLLDLVEKEGRTVSARRGAPVSSA